MTGIPENSDWRLIDYHPAIPVLPLDHLVPFLSNIKTAVDLGCNTGSVSLLLAEHGIDVLGLDINGSAIQAAQERAENNRLSHIARFQTMDILESADLGVFDLVLLIRTLTCFPEPFNWKRVLDCAQRHVKPCGIVYIHDFVLSPEIGGYEVRYREGLRRGWRAGNFPVSDASGKLLFVAHHHSDDELQEIAAPYEELYFGVHLSLSMNGNECKMFELIGRKT